MGMFANVRRGIAVSLVAGLVAAVGISPAAASNSAFPRLLRCRVIALQSQTNPAVGHVALDFSEPVTGKTPEVHRLHIFKASGGNYNASAASASGASVTAAFPSAALQTAATCAVDRNAVTDTSAKPNPEASAALRKIVMRGGRTEGPDLLSVTSLRTNVQGFIMADLTFDQRVSPSSAAQVRLIGTDGSAITAAEFTNADGTAFSGGAKSALTARFSVTASDLPLRQVARGVAGAGAVLGIYGFQNVLQATDIGLRTTSDPDLVFARLTADGTSMRFRFDEPVQSTVTASKFCVYRYDMSSSCGTTAERSGTDPRDVVVRVIGARSATGATAADAAVTASDTADGNRTDHVVLPDVVLQPGRTFGADLVRVAILTDPVTAKRTVRYTFGAPVTAYADGNAANGELADVDFALYDATGARLAASTATGCTAGSGPAGSNSCIRPVSGNTAAVDVAGFTATQTNAAAGAAVNDVSGDSNGGTMNAIWPIVPEGYYSFRSYNHGRSVSLSLGKHVVAEGRVRVDDTAKTCAAAVGVALQRRISGEWKTVKTVTTTAGGAFKSSLPDRAGTYRAVANAWKPGQADTCGKAVSGTRTHDH